jgi:hypothetical protein
MHHMKGINRVIDSHDRYSHKYCEAKVKWWRGKCVMCVRTSRHMKSHQITSSGRVEAIHSLTLRSANMGLYLR